jgi:hypothetical protein
VGLNSGEVVVRAIGNDLHMDYSAIGQTTHLAARMEQLAAPGSILLTTETLRLAEEMVQVKPLGPRCQRLTASGVFDWWVPGPRGRLGAFAARTLTLRGAPSRWRRCARHAGRCRPRAAVAVMGNPGGETRLFYVSARGPEAAAQPRGLLSEATPITRPWLLKPTFGWNREEAGQLHKRSRQAALTGSALDRSCLPCSLFDVPWTTAWQALRRRNGASEPSTPSRACWCAKRVQPCC